MDGVAQALGFVGSKDVVYAQQGPDRGKGGSKAAAGLFEGVFSPFGQGVVGV